MLIVPLWRVTLRAVQDWSQDNYRRLAASLAYYTALSLAPLVLLIIGVVGLGLDRQQVVQRLTMDQREHAKRNRRFRLQCLCFSYDTGTDIGDSPAKP